MRREAENSLVGDILRYGWEIGITTTGLIVAAALYYKRVNQKSEIKTLSIADSQQQFMTLSTNLFFDKNAQIEKVISEIQLSSAGHLSLGQIGEIYARSLDIIQDEYVKFTKEIRKRRRLIRKINEDQYLHMVLDYELKVKDLIERGREELAVALDIPKERYQESIFQIHHGGEREAYYRLDQLSRQTIKEKMRKKRSLSDKTAKQILNQQLKFMKSKLYQRYYQTLKKQSVNQAGILAVIHTIIEDFIYQKYGFQQQHLILKKMDEAFSNSEDVKNLVEALNDQEEILVSQIVGCIQPDTHENDYE